MSAVLIIGRHQQIMDRVVTVLQGNSFEIYYSLTNQGAVDLLNQHKIDVVIIGGGVDIESREMLKSAFKTVNPNVKFLERFESLESLPIEINKLLES